MLQQTGVKTVGPYFEKFLARWPDVAALGRASLDDVLRMWAGLGYYSRARNLHACAVAVLRDHGGAFPDTEEGLRALPGIGPYTAAAIAAIAFGRRTMPVDGNIERVVSRLFAVEEPLPQAKPLIQQLAATLLGATRAGDEKSRAGDSAQALMDLGSSICTPKKPACALCPLNDDCAARARGDQETFPRKAPKKTGALRRGAAFVVTRGDRATGSHPPRKRPARRHDRSADLGLARRAGRQAGAEAGAGAEGPARWHRKVGVVTHVFTHFPLELVVYTARVPARTRAPEGMRWVPIATLAGRGAAERDAQGDRARAWAATPSTAPADLRVLRRQLDDRRLGVEAFDLKTGDALVVGGDVFQFLLRQHVGDDVVTVGRALLDHLHHLLRPVAAVEHHEIGRRRPALGLVGDQRGIGRARAPEFRG